MKIRLGLLPIPHSQILIHTPHISKNWSAEFHTTFNDPRFIIANNPSNSIYGECFRCGGGRIGESYFVEPEPDLGIEGLFEFV